MHLIQQLLINMNENSSYSMPSIGDHSHRPYRRLDKEERKQLLIQVFANNMTIAKAAQKLGINNSTAKVIVRKYRNDHRSKRAMRDALLPQTGMQNQQTHFESPQTSQSGVQICYVYVPMVNVTVNSASGEHFFSFLVPY